MVGLGRWAVAHAEAVARSDLVRIVNCYARNAGARDEYRSRHAVPVAAGSLEALLADPAVEAVVIATPNDVHVEQALACLEAGKPVLIDKPVAVDTAEGLQLLRAADSSGVPVGVAHHPRRLAGIRAAGAWVASGAAGVVRTARADFSNNRGAHLEPDAWRRVIRGSEGGVLTQVGIHQVENLLYLLGPVVTVNARFQHRTLGPTVPDLAVVSMVHADGAISVVTSNWSTPGNFTLDLLATGGNLSYRLDHRRWTSPDVDEHCELWFQPAEGERHPHPFGRSDPLREQIEELAHSTRGGTMEVDVAAGLRATVVVEAAVRSAATEGEPCHTADLLRQSGATSEEVARLLG